MDEKASRALIALPLSMVQMELLEIMHLSFLKVILQKLSFCPKELVKKRTFTLNIAISATKTRLRLNFFDLKKKSFLVKKSFKKTKSDDFSDSEENF